MFIHGPRLAQLESRAEGIGDHITGAFDSIALTVSDWYRSFDDINITRSLWLEQVNSTLLPLVAQAYDDSANDTWEKLSAIDVEIESSLTAALIPKLVRNAAETFLEAARQRLVAIGEVLWNAMRIELLQGLQLGEGIGALRTRLVNSARVATPRARSAAQTEIIGASNAGSFQQMKAAQVTALKTWVARNDDHVRPSHHEVDGTQVDMNVSFIVGGHAMDYPHDPTAPPEEVYNCRCTLIWEIIRQGEVTDELVIQSLAADAFHLPGKHDQGDHAHKGSQSDSRESATPKIKQMLSAYEAGYEVISDIEPGASGASIQRLRLSDGTEVMRKSTPRGSNGRDVTRAEYLGGRVLNAVGITDVHTAQLDDDTIITTYVPGPSGSRTMAHLEDLPFDDYERSYNELLNTQVTSPGGKAIGVADWLMVNVDRHAFNWIMTSDGVRPIDQGDARFINTDIDPGSPFSTYWLGVKSAEFSGQVTSINPRVTRSDVATYRERLRTLENEFDQPGEREYFDSIMARLDSIERTLTSD